MTPATLTRAVPGALARAGQGHSGNDATGHGGKFDTVLADVAQGAEPAAPGGESSDPSGDIATALSAQPATLLGLAVAADTQAPSARALASPPAQQAEPRDVHAMLAQIANGSTTTTVIAGAASDIASKASAPRARDASTRSQTKDAAPTSDVAPGGVSPLAAAFVGMPGALAVTATAAPAKANATPIATPTLPLGPSTAALAAAPADPAATAASRPTHVEIAVVGQANYLAPPASIGPRVDMNAPSADEFAILGEAGQPAPASAPMAPGGRAGAKAAGTTGGRPAPVGAPVAADVGASANDAIAGAATVAPVTPANAPGDAHAAKADATKTDTTKTDTTKTDGTGATAIARDASPDTALPAGTLQTIADTVASLADDAAGTPATAQAAQAAPRSTYVAPARSLTLQLTPGSLGTVTVHLHMTSGGLDLRLAVEKDGTLGALTHARDELGAAIGGTGTRLESLIIQSAPASATAGSNDTPRSQSDTPAGDSFANQSGGQGSGGSGGGSNRDTRQGGSAPARPPAAAARDRGGDGVFV